MATIKVMLAKGLKIGEAVHLEAEIREASVADMLDASSESERVVATPDGYQLVASPLLVGINTLRRQIIRIGGYAGPLTMEEIKKLQPGDLNLLQEKAAALEQASMAEVLARGRGDGAAADD